MNYYGVNEKYEAIKAQAESEAAANDGEISEYLAEALDAAEIEKEDAIFGIMYDIKNGGAELGKLKAVIADLTEKKKAIETRIDSRKLLLARLAGKEAYSDGVVSTTKAVSASLVLDGDIPAEYKSTEMKPVEKIDKAGIKAHLQDGGSLDFAHLEYRKAVK